MSVFFLCVLFCMFKLFFPKCFSNFLLSRLTFAFNFCALLLLTTNYYDIYKSIFACTFVAPFNKLYYIQKPAPLWPKIKLIVVNTCSGTVLFPPHSYSNSQPTAPKTAKPRTATEM